MESPAGVTATKGHKMKIECKLINPLTLQLKRPMLSPLEETEFYIIGVKAFRKGAGSLVRVGIIIGIAFSVFIALLQHLTAGAP
jgi:hypothetical protein